MNRIRKFLSLTLIATLGALPAVTAWSMKSIPGLPVKKITRASDIDSWQVIDRTHVVLSLSANRNYLLTLRQNCTALAVSRQLGISSSNNTVYAGFDYITADGQRCGIQAISRLSKDEVLALRG